VFMVPCSRDGFCKWFSTGLDTRNCPWKRFEHIATTALPCRASTLWILHFLFPNSRPRYTLLQRIRRKHALLKAPVVDGNDYVNPFTHEQMRELMLDVAFWLQETLFAHYWEEDRSLSWEEFLKLTENRSDIKAAAANTLHIFPLICRPDLDPIAQVLSAAPSRYDYASRADLIPPESRAVPPLIVSALELEDTVERVLYKLEMALYLKTTKPTQRIGFMEFCQRIDEESVLAEMIVQRTRWVFSANLGKLKAIWAHKKLIELPPLRIP